MYVLSIPCFEAYTYCTEKARNIIYPQARHINDNMHVELVWVDECNSRTVSM